ncbi:HNH endonuclease [Psychroserpens algicola]|uniref:HNH endonuclease n=1 Tax=Psychroserpens algicola TaxID=1719034 RepID=UPI00195474C8|nr:HNH endonuclease [Psychroserpens algicola]
MRYTVFNKKDSIVPDTVSKYGDYKPYLRREAKEKCVYCAIHENPIGGSDHFHVEHYKPKSLEEFAGLVKDYNNLFYACAICNRFKSNDWPNEPVPDHSVISYPNPNEIDYNTLFKHNGDGTISGNFIASTYIVEKIFLNRPQLINERKENFIRENYVSEANKLINLSKSLLTKKGSQTAAELLYEINVKITEISLLLNKDKEIARYEPSEIKRNK